MQPGFGSFDPLGSVAILVRIIVEVSPSRSLILPLKVRYNVPHSTPGVNLGQDTNCPIK